MNSWLRVCSLEQVPVERGVAVLVEGEQIALFRTATDELHAVDNLCPFSGAMVISRGIVGTRGERPTVASPMFKQVFDLLSAARPRDDSGDWTQAIDSRIEQARASVSTRFATIRRFARGTRSDQ